MLKRVATPLNNATVSGGRHRNTRVVPCLTREGDPSDVVVRLRRLGDGGDAIESVLNGGTFSLFPSPSRAVIEVRGRLGLGVLSGVWS
jgi:hypothetical protein